MISFLGYYQPPASMVIRRTQPLRLGRRIKRCWRELTLATFIALSLGFANQIKATMSRPKPPTPLSAMEAAIATPAPVQPAATSTPTALPPQGPAKSKPTVDAFFARGQTETYQFGHCTYYVAGKRPVPPGWGHAKHWYGRANAAGFATGTEPSVGAIAWTSAGYYGHVALVEAVEGPMVLVSEMNYTGWNKISRRWVPASTFKYIY